MLRNENIPVVHQEHAYDDADVALTMALPWVHELGWPPRQCDPAAGPRNCEFDLKGVDNQASRRLAK